MKDVILVMDMVMLDIIIVKLVLKIILENIYIISHGIYIHIFVFLNLKDQKDHT